MCFIQLPLTEINSHFVTIFRDCGRCSNVLQSQRIIITGNIYLYVMCSTKIRAQEIVNINQFCEHSYDRLVYFIPWSEHVNQMYTILWIMICIFVFKCVFLRLCLQCVLFHPVLINIYINLSAIQFWKRNSYNSNTVHIFWNSKNSIHEQNINCATSSHHIYTSICSNSTSRVFFDEFSLYIGSLTYHPWKIWIKIRFLILYMN